MILPLTVWMSETLTSPRADFWLAWARAGAAELNAAQVVEVPGLGVEDLSEKPFLDKVQTEHFGAVIATVLHHDAVAPRFFGRLNERPAVLVRIGRRGFGGGVFAGPHCFQADRHMAPPRGGRGAP